MSHVNAAIPNGDALAQKAGRGRAAPIASLDVAPLMLLLPASAATAPLMLTTPGTNAPAAATPTTPVAPAKPAAPASNAPAAGGAK